MTQSKPRQVQVLVPRTAVAPRRFAASMLSARTVMFSLLVDRALSA
ncbi:hypothetical protein B0G80_3901 [Paraburkholderia sp. BL6669N2]|nr:hypothetical protein B0G80_3901 [Paraburkholderia sp. BL6669N2]